MIAVTSKSSHPIQAKAFLNWQWSAAGQTIWAQQGYRPVLASVAKKFAGKFPTPPFGEHHGDRHGFRRGAFFGPPPAARPA